MEKPQAMSQVKSGFRLVALILIGFVVAAMFFGGVIGLFSPGAVDRSSWSGRHTVFSSLGDMTGSRVVVAIISPATTGVGMPVPQPIRSYDLLEESRWPRVMPIAGGNG